MRTVTISVAIALFAVALPTTTAQEGLPTQGKVVGGGCDELENCDPVKANGGRLILSTENEPVRMVLFGHFRDVLQAAPINTQLPDPEEEPDIKGRFLMPTIYTEDQGAPCCKFEFNRFNMYSSPGFVEFLPGGEWRVHHEPGLAEEVRIVPIDDKFIYGYWYMSVNAKPSGVSPGPEAGLMPAVGVYMKMNLGRFPSSNEADVIAEGDTGTGFGENPDIACLQASDSCVTLLTTPEGQVYEFRVPMGVKRPIIPSVWDQSVDQKKHGYTVHVVPYQVEQGDARFTQADWTVRTGADFPPRIVLDVANPMITKSTRIHTFDDYLFFRWSFTSPWGSYDVDPNALALLIEGPKNVGPNDVEFIMLRYSPDHDGHFKPLNATWRYDYVNNPLPPGKYKVSAMTHNYQNTYMLVWAEEFTVDSTGVPQVEHIGTVATAKDVTGDPADGSSPGLGIAGFVGAAAIALVAIRSRNRR